MIRKITPQDSQEIAILHKKTIKEALFSKLGVIFLKKMYTQLLKRRNFSGYCFIDEKTKEIVGFVTYSMDKKFFSTFVKNNFFVLSLNVIIAILKKPSTISNLIDTLFCLFKDNLNLESEIFSIAINEKYQGKSIGKELIKKTIKDLKDKKIKSLKVLVDSKLSANTFYKKQKFTFVKKIKTGKRSINIYQLKISK